MKMCRENAVPISGATGIKDIEKLALDNKFEEPVTKGTRYSLVIWNLGYPFK